MQKLVTIILLVLSLGGLSTQAFADGAYGNSSSRLAPFQELIEAEKYQAAIQKLQTALAEKADDADLLNLLAYSQRKLGKFEVALVNYQKALAIDPTHRGANEYLGELYLQMDQPELAEQRLKVLDDDCFFGCREFDDLQQAIENYRNKNQ
jgi:Flp pilus assembly protein TadD